MASRLPGVDYYTEFMDHLIESGEIEFTQPKDTNECWRGLADGSFDLVIQAEFASVAQHAELGLTDEIARSDTVVSTQSYHAIFPSGTTTTYDSPTAENLSFKFSRLGFT